MLLLCLNFIGVNPFTKLIYPAPVTNAAGLGIHATIDMAGQLRFGPDTHYIPYQATPDHRVPHRLKPAFLSAIKRYYPNMHPDKLHPGCAGIKKGAIRLLFLFTSSLD
ncbi:MAG: L-2-hydroxyglutarate oxidase LhgO [Shewanella sp.]|jgi:L-2-hydroxyglutarate oxidase LhgO